jgi:hypothetical protein
MYRRVIEDNESENVFKEAIVAQLQALAWNLRWGLRNATDIHSQGIIHPVRTNSSLEQFRKR